MNTTEPALIPRREFLRGASLLVAAAALGLETTAKASASPASTSLTTLSFWSGSQFVNPASFASGAASLAMSDAHIKIHGHYVPSNAAHGLLHTVKAHYAVMVNGKLTDLPVYSWVASSPKGKDASLQTPVGPGGGLLFSVELNTPKSTEEYYFLSSGKTPGQAKLQPGSYIITVGVPDWRGSRLTEIANTPVIVRDTPTGVAPVDFEYLIITVSAA